MRQLWTLVIDILPDGVFIDVNLIDIEIWSQKIGLLYSKIFALVLATKISGKLHVQ